MSFWCLQISFQKTNEIFSRISALASKMGSAKMRSNQKIGTLYKANWRILLPTFADSRGLGVSEMSILQIKGISSHFNQHSSENLKPSRCFVSCKAKGHKYLKVEGRSNPRFLEMQTVSYQECRQISNLGGDKSM